MNMRDWSKERIFCIDFDGVLANYAGYKGEDILWEPITWSKEFVLLLQKKGFTPVIFTTRKEIYLKEWLQTYDFPDLEITNTKYPAWIYIDDRCLKFDGNYDKLVSDMQNFEVYWEKRDKKRFENLLEETAL